MDGCSNTNMIWCNPIKLHQIIIDSELTQKDTASDCLKSSQSCRGPQANLIESGLRLLGLQINMEPQTGVDLPKGDSDPEHGCGFGFLVCCCGGRYNF